MKHTIRTSALAILTVSLATLAWAEAPATAPSTQPAAQKLCVVSDEELGSMGEAIVLKHEGRDVKFCCESCVKAFKKNPEKYLKKLDAAPATQPTAG